MNNKLDYTGAQPSGFAPCSFKISLTLSILVILLAICAGQAWSFESIPAGEAGKYVRDTNDATNTYSSSSPVQSDTCLALLNRHASAGSAMVEPAHGWKSGGCWPCIRDSVCSQTIPRVQAVQT